jgi:hypothetical protein
MRNGSRAFSLSPGTVQPFPTCSSYDNSSKCVPSKAPTESVGPANGWMSRCFPRNLSGKASRSFIQEGNSSDARKQRIKRQCFKSTVDFEQWSGITRGVAYREVIFTTQLVYLQGRDCRSPLEEKARRNKEGPEDPEKQL